MVDRRWVCAACGRDDGRSSGYDQSTFEALTTAWNDYQVTCRIAERTTTIGDSRNRYDDLVSRLGAFDAVEGGSFRDRAHTSTSAWMVSFQGSAEELLRRLQPSVTAHVGMLEVIEVVTGNVARLP